MKSPNGLRAIFFDLDGTLRFDQPNSVEVFVRYARELGLSLTDAAVLSAERWSYHYWAGNDEWRADRAAFEADSEAFWTNYNVTFLSRMGASGSLEEYAAAIQGRFLDEYRPIHRVPDDVPPTLRTLRTRGFVVGLVSNRDKPLTGICDELGLTDLFDFTLSAGQANAWKPAREIFDVAARMAGVPNQAAAYVGDNHHADVLGAAGAGLHPILIDPRELFPQATCQVIRAIGDLLHVL